MPDIKTALSTALSSWEQDDQKIQQEKKVPRHMFTPTNNVTIETFNFVRDNPLRTSGEIANALQARGFNKGSVGSLLTQFTKQGQFVRDDNGRYKTVIREYTPLKSTKKFRAENKRVNKIVSKPKSDGIAALAPQVTATSQWDADTIINNIGLKQARALYDELKKLFGG
jgi:transcriptional/translational regulatory protein YebC/TACO1